MLLQILHVVIFIYVRANSVQDVVQFPCFTLLVCFVFFCHDILIIERVFYKISALLCTDERTNTAQCPHIRRETVRQRVYELFWGAPGARSDAIWQFFGGDVHVGWGAEVADFNDR